MMAELKISADRASTPSKDHALHRWEAQLNLTALISLQLPRNLAINPIFSSSGNLRGRLGSLDCTPPIRKLEDPRTAKVNQALAEFRNEARGDPRL